jgi:lysophospholipase L1-like esterase
MSFAINNSPLHPHTVKSSIIRLATAVSLSLQLHAQLPENFASITADEAGQLKIEFQGELQESSNLVRWQSLVPQPSSPYLLQTSAAHMFYRVANAAPFQSRIIAFLGDSITDRTSQRETYGPLFQQFGQFSIFGSTYTAMSGRFSFARRSNAWATDSDYGYSGASSAQLLNGFSGHQPLVDAIASNADTVVIHCGINDSGASPSTTVANIVSMVSAVRAAGKNCIVLPILPPGNKTATLIAEAGRLARVQATNSLIPHAVRAAGAVCIEWQDEVRLDNEGYAISNDILDPAHPTIVLTSRLGNRLAQELDKYVQPHIFDTPALGSSLWLTPNPGMAGPSTTLATSYVANSGGADNTYLKVTDESGKIWQQVTCVSATPYSRHSIYIRLASGAESHVGKKVRATLRLDCSKDDWDSKGFSVASNAKNTSGSDLSIMELLYQSDVIHRNAVTEPTQPISGLYLLPEFVIPPDTSQLWVQIIWFGSCQFRFTDCGVMEIQ